MNFGEDYAKAYDAFYRTKDYVGEAKFVRDRLRLVTGDGALNILDLGCGTGLHDVELVSAGHTVMGVDMSTQMLAHAVERRRKLPAAVQQRLEFRSGDARTVRAEQTFDAGISLFHVMSYILVEVDLEVALATARSHLSPGRAFLFDFWYGPAVVADPPQRRARDVEENGRHIRRVTTPHWNKAHDTVRIVFDVEETDDAGIVRRTSEDHVMRYFFESGLQTAMSAAGFKIVEIAEWLTGVTPGEKSFGVYVIARAV
mgnify:CR=1 FL=1